jgi:quinol monooxygenase YgiN
MTILPLWQEFGEPTRFIFNEESVNHEAIDFYIVTAHVQKIYWAEYWNFDPMPND